MRNSVRPLSLELDEKLGSEGIISSYFYDPETSKLVLVLNHEYTEKTISSALELEKWTEGIAEFKEKMTAEGIDPIHRIMICDTLANNHERILKHVKGQRKRAAASSRVSNEKEKKNREFIAFKYSNEGMGHLHEAVILAGKPAFLTYEYKTNKITAVPEIVEEVRTIIPSYKENYPAYTPYEFDNLEDVNDYLNRARNGTIDSLYLQAKEIALFGNWF
jgi:hypothetical protein